MLAGPTQPGPNPLGLCTTMILHERRAAAPAGFVRVEAAGAGEMLTLRVGLTSNNLSGVEEQLRSIATPGSSNFRQWLTMDEAG
ncbi:hypothetical protein C8R45DRAFT_1112519 [Mycena sanguinolenta]|nr:hypothetical protein C8R45DRAFT_1112519 [Mycena sanguinolenta]